MFFLNVDNFNFNIVDRGKILIVTTGPRLVNKQEKKLLTMIKW